MGETLKTLPSSERARELVCVWLWPSLFLFHFPPTPCSLPTSSHTGKPIAATTLHLYAQEKLFNRAIATGGSCLLVPPVTAEVQEQTYQAVLGILGLEKLQPEERIQQLLTLPLDQIIAKIPPYVAFMPTVDGEIIPCKPTFAAIADPADESMPAKRWLDGLMIGDSQFDGSVLGFMLAHLKPNIRQRFPASIRSSFSSTPNVAESLLELYGFTSPVAADQSQDDEACFMKYLQLSTDMGFYAATISFARGWRQGSQHQSSSKIFPFFFNEPNPWPGPYQGYATHVLDVVFLFQNYNDKLPPAQRAAAEGFALDLMRFVAGQDPWDAYTPEKGTAKVFGPSIEVTGRDEPAAGDVAVSKVVDDAESEATSRKTALLQLGQEVGFDKLDEALGRFRMGL